MLRICFISIFVSYIIDKNLSKQNSSDILHWQQHYTLSWPRFVTGLNARLLEGLNEGEKMYLWIMMVREKNHWQLSWTARRTNHSMLDKLK